MAAVQKTKKARQCTAAMLQLFLMMMIHLTRLLNPVEKL